MTEGVSQSLALSSHNTYPTIQYTVFNEQQTSRQPRENKKKKGNPAMTRLLLVLPESEKEKTFAIVHGIESHPFQKVKIC